eukprot:comp24342_c2_seq15/m.46389 comp24342_c2_seq15/g.46389  ORF comp24342_c2_seq15/g.46389 comp24342_c2_seq15/m.46389 type:complete len:207 (-) comp24342_c2_seq15:9-629(-)
MTGCSCAANWCNQKVGQGSVRIPKYKATSSKRQVLREQWFEKIGRIDKINKKNLDIIESTREHRLCRRHFALECFDPVTNRLRDKATVLPFSQNEEEEYWAKKKLETARQNVGEQRITRGTKRQIFDESTEGDTPQKVARARTDLTDEDRQLFELSKEELMKKYRLKEKEASTNNTCQPTSELCVGRAQGNGVAETSDLASLEITT